MTDIRVCNVNSPCKDCQKREVGCHSTCEVYTTFRKEREAVYEKKVQTSIQKRDLLDHLHKAFKRKKQNSSCPLSYYKPTKE